MLWKPMKTQVKCIIAGSRNITDKELVMAALRRFKKDHPEIKIIEIVSGGTRGVDTLGEQIAQEYNIPVKKFPAQWKKYGGRAGLKRNTEMAAYAKALIAVWDGKSSGTFHMIQQAEAAGLIITVINTQTFPF